MVQNGSEVRIIVGDEGRCFVYFFSAGWSPIKIGVSQNPDERMAALSTAHYKEMRILYLIECVDRETAFRLEAGFHRWYADRRLRNEWFDIKLAELILDIELIDVLANGVVAARWVVDFADLRRVSENQAALDVVRARQKAERGLTPAQRTALDFLEANPGAAELPIRDVVAGAGVNRHAVSVAKRVWRAGREAEAKDG